MKKLVCILFLSTLLATGLKAQQTQIYSAHEIEATDGFKIKTVRVTKIHQDSALSITDSLSLVTPRSVIKYVLGKINVGKGTIDTLTYSASVALNLSSSSLPLKSIAITGTLTATTLTPTIGKNVEIKITGGASIRSLTWPAGWTWVGSAAPTTLAANKMALLTLLCFGTTDNDIIARWYVQP